MNSRRHFLKLFGAACVASWNAPISFAEIREARAIIASGALGEVHLCRVTDTGLLAEIQPVLTDCSGFCIAEVDPAADGAIFLGSAATLVVRGGGCVRYSV